MPGTFPADVIAAAIACHGRCGIPASVTLAQWACESAWGRAMSGKNNPFGIKARPGQPGTPRMTREVLHGQVVHMTQTFADYPDMTGAFEAHGELLAQGAPYAHARSLLPDAEAFAHALTGVYATDPRYGDTLVGIMRANGLAEYDSPRPPPPASAVIARAAPAVPSPGALPAVTAAPKPGAVVMLGPDESAPAGLGARLRFLFTGKAA